MRLRALILGLLMLPLVVLVPVCNRDHDQAQQAVTQSPEISSEINTLARHEAEEICKKSWKIQTSFRPDSQILTWVIRSGNEQKTLTVFLPSHSAGWTYLLLDNRQSQTITFQCRSAGYSETGRNIDVSDFLAPVVPTIGAQGSSSARLKAPSANAGVAFSI